MAYCRFSSDNFQCDVYCYYSCDDKYVIHVASVRREGKIIPFPDPFLSEEEWWIQYETHKKSLENCKLVPINLPYSGEDFILDTIEEFEQKLILLKTIGYRIPDYVFEIIKKEKEGTKNK